MKELKVTIIDPVGIHARPAGAIVQETKKLDSEVEIYANNKKVSAKNILGILSLGVRCNQEMTFTFKGGSEQKSLEAIQKVLKANKLTK